MKKAAGNGLALSIGQSFSGNERNKLFYSRNAEQFVDLSAVSGLDNIADSRVLALWDFDRDGWQDMAVVNANTPLLNIYHNEIGAAADSTGKVGRMIAIRFVGGSRTAEPNQQFGCRDGYGAKIRVTAGELNLIREYRCGEGMAGQNSSTMVVGIGDNDVVQTVNIRWLSGIQQQVHDLPAGTLLTVYEDPQSAPDQSAAVREPYVIPSSIRWQDSDSDEFTAVPGVLRYDSIQTSQPDDMPESEVLLYTTMATWCAACKSHLPQLQQLRSELDAETLGMYGVPVDPTDDATKLSEYAQRYQPAYTLLRDLTDEQRKLVEALIVDALKVDALPSTVVTDTEGNVLLITTGLPTVSQLNKLIHTR